MTVKGQHIKAPKAPCPICGKVMTKPGLVGHMRWEHGKDYKAPLLNVSKPMSFGKTKHATKRFDVFIDNLGKQSTVPLLPSTAMPRAEEKRKAQELDEIKPLISPAAVVYELKERGIPATAVADIEPAANGAPGWLGALLIALAVGIFAWGQTDSGQAAIARDAAEKVARRAWQQ